MPQILVIKNAKLEQFDPYKALIQMLRQGELSPGTKEEQLQYEINGEVVYSARQNRSNRLLYLRLNKGSEQEVVVLCRVAGKHKYKSALHSLAAIQGDIVLQDYKEDDADSDEGLEEEINNIRLVLSAEGTHYEEPYLHHQRFVLFDDDQSKGLLIPAPVIFHGGPGTGKTLVMDKSIDNYTDKPVIDEDGLPLGFLCLAPTDELLDKARANYQENCAFRGVNANLGTFLTYKNFFKQKASHDGQVIADDALVTFIDFERWYSAIPAHKRPKLTAGDCWAAFRLCSLYEDALSYENNLSDAQCAVPKVNRRAIYDIYERFRNYCQAEGLYSPWINRVQSSSRYGLVLADELQTQSGAMVWGVYQAAVNGNFISVVGGHQKIDECDSGYGRGSSAVDLLAVLLHETKRFTTHHLTQTHRNSKTVLAILNWFIEQKNLAGLQTTLKGAEMLLHGDNGLDGEGLFIIEEQLDALAAEAQAAVDIANKPADAVSASLGNEQASAGRKQLASGEWLKLQRRFQGYASVVVITPESYVNEARILWPGMMVLTPEQSIGLEYEHVICYRLIAEVNDRLLSKALTSANPQKANGHLAKVQPSLEVASLESWFHHVILGNSRSKDGIYFVEAPLSRHLALFCKGLQDLCGHGQDSAAISKPLTPSTDEEWLDQVRPLLSKGEALREEAKRIIDIHVAKDSPVYQKFLSLLLPCEGVNPINAASNISKSAVTVISRPRKVASMSAAIQETPQLSSKDIRSVSAGAAGDIVSSSKAAIVTFSKSAKTKNALIPKKKTMLLPREALEIKLLSSRFTEADLNRSFSKGCDVVKLFDTLIHEGGQTYGLISLLDNPENLKTFVNFVCNNVLKLKEIVDTICKYYDLQIVEYNAEKSNIKVSLGESSAYLYQSAFFDIIILRYLVGDEIGHPLIIAARKNLVSSINLLISVGIDPNRPLLNGFYAIHHAVICQSNEAIYALQKAGVSIHQLTAEASKSPLYLAIMAGCDKVLPVLVELGADLEQMFNSEENENAFSLAFSAPNNLKMMETLLRLKSNDSSEFICKPIYKRSVAVWIDWAASFNAADKMTLKINEAKIRDDEDLCLSLLDLAEIFQNRDILKLLHAHIAKSSDKLAAAQLRHFSILNGSAVDVSFLELEQSLAKNKCGN